MNNCIFCRIANGEIPCAKIYEDEYVVAFLDLGQITYGHTLVIPKKHVRNILELDSDTATQVFRVVNNLSKKIVKKLNAKGCNILSNAEEIAGQSVFHFHVHIIPRYDENDGFSYKTRQNKFDLEEIKAKII